MDKLKKSGMDMDMNIEQMDWVEDNKKVYLLSLLSFCVIAYCH